MDRRLNTPCLDRDSVAIMTDASETEPRRPSPKALYDEQELDEVIDDDLFPDLGEGARRDMS